MDNKTVFKNVLAGHLATHCNMDLDGVLAVSKRYDVLVKTAEPHIVFGALLDYYGSTDVTKATEATASILSELEKLNREHEGIDKNVATRCSAWVTRHNTKVNSLSVELIDERGNVTDFTQAARKEATVQRPKFLPNVPYAHVAKGSYQDKTIDLSVEVIL